ncbi:hypothetical protein M8542_48490 [Amycolatopsis sp. OK19-0408]|uniref:Uncharacterized protein n=1 Tax=Amycolatopsis iheyensis TaxID=2945988 RepID=A0A9X2NL13_9PSEU|nr:hypothetical protein [Amycolatopsis iheyensis]MCR6490664.1 hypothetical protein [Amycolatopsis iheyensis]
MSASHWVKVPVGPQSRRWNTAPVERTILVVVHTVTALNRLQDLLTVFDSDRRVQLVYTIPGASAIESGVERELARLGAALLSWQQALATEFDLAISVHNSGNLHDIAAPLAVLSHGIGYTKYSSRKPEAGSRKPEAGSRKPEAGNRKPETGNRDVYGLSAQWLLHGGSVVPSAIILSHEAELERLAATVPAATAAAVIAGDPCFDRLAASYRSRDTYRKTLGADANTRIVFVSSTWGRNSLFGRFPELIARVLAELDLDNHVVCTALHPNIWYAHGPAQIELWLGDCLRAGLRLVPPARGWQQALLAADVVLGDHGAVTGYAAALGKPTLLATFPQDDVVARSAIGALGRTTPHLDQHRPLAVQLDEIIAAPHGDGEVRRLATSVPDESAALLRSTFYGLMNLPEPSTAALLPSYRAVDLAPLRDEVRAWWAVTEVLDENSVRLRRWPADVTSPRGGPPEPLDGHLVVADDHPRRDLYGLAAVVLAAPTGPPPAEVFAAHPVCRLVVQRVDLVHCRVVTRAGGTALLRSSRPDVAEAAAAALVSWVDAGKSLDSLPKILVGPHTVELTAGRQ